MILAHSSLILGRAVRFCRGALPPVARLRLTRSRADRRRGPALRRGPFLLLSGRLFPGDRALAGRTKRQEQLENHADEAELLLGGMYLSYGHHLEAAEIFERLLADNVDSDIRDRTWFFLAKIWLPARLSRQGARRRWQHRGRAAEKPAARSADARSAQL